MINNKLLNVSADPLNSGFYKTIMEEMPDSILAVQPGGQISYANQSALLMYGYSVEEVQLLHIQDLHTVDTVEIERNQWYTASQNILVYRTKHLRRDGGAFSVELKCRRTYLKGAEIFLVIIRDMTEVIDL
jgi:PAS domain S-box-containing protein